MSSQVDPSVTTDVKPKPKQPKDTKSNLSPPKYLSPISSQITKLLVWRFLLLIFILLCLVSVYFILSIIKLNKRTEDKLKKLNQLNSQLKQKSGSSMHSSQMQEYINTL